MTDTDKRRNPAAASGPGADLPSSSVTRAQPAASRDAGTSLTPADQAQLDYAAKTNAAVRHVMAELARVQAERDSFHVLLRSVQSRLTRLSLFPNLQRGAWSEVCLLDTLISEKLGPRHLDKEAGQ